jgi:hypothetical protein
MRILQASYLLHFKPSIRGLPILKNLSCMQELCVVEAMKMQNVLRCEKDGVVEKIPVKVRVEG